MSAVQTPQQAVTRLEKLHAEATRALADAVARYLGGGPPPTPEERARFRYPELRVSHAPTGAAPKISRAFGQLIWPGDYVVTITQPKFFRAYILEQLALLVNDYGATVSVGVSDTEIPYAFVMDGSRAIDMEKVSASELTTHFPYPQLALVGDSVVDGMAPVRLDGARPLALFDAPRIDYSLKRLQHYTGAPWAHTQPWILFTNYQRYVEEFVRWAAGRVVAEPEKYRLSCPGGVTVEGDSPDPVETALNAPWRKYQMPAYHLIEKGGEGVTLINIGVGPSNAKTITDHLAVLRPHCWMMIGHCGGFRHSQRIGDYVLAHAYLRRDKVLDDHVPLDIPIPAIAEVQLALAKAAQTVSGDTGEALKRRLRTGTVVSYADRNWELSFQQERRILSQSRAIAVDMESACIATQGFRLRVPYGVLLCVSDKPLHGEIKLPGAADRFYDRAIGEHLKIGIETIEILKRDKASLHSRKLRSFDEPPFR
ncbi:MAG: AMP nucleosidase [Hyphomonadaceae bacterium]|nr:AMP nucleosidase [Hyphomonadaceae bacterium]